MADIFISYASEDRDRVRPLAQALISRGFSVWWDRALSAGQDYTATIEQELRAAKAVIVVWTRNATASTFVRDEAGRARDDGRLVPVMFDKVDIPLGFGAFQAEDFTRWNGGSNAPQLQLLEEVLKAKLAGRDVDGSAIERRRRRLGARIRLVSLLTVIALVVGIAVGGKYLFAPPEPDLRAQLLQLLAEGKLTPEQAIQLAGLLETEALGPKAAMEQTPADGQQAPAAEVDDVTLASVSEAEFDAEARDTYTRAFQAVSQHPDAQVRLAAAQLVQPGSRDAGMQAMWAFAQSHPDDPLRDEMYLLCGTVGEANNDALGQRALEAATTIAPQDAGAWRLLSRSYRRTNQSDEAQGAALVSQGVAANEQGRTAEAEAQLSSALPHLRTAQLRAPVESQLGQIAESRGDYNQASTFYAQAYQSREQTLGEPQTAPAANAALAADAQQLVLALDRAGRTQEACTRLQQAQEAHDVDTPDAELLQRCQRLRVDLRSRVELAPVLREQRAIQVQRAPAQQVTPAP